MNLPVFFNARAVRLRMISEFACLGFCVTINLVSIHFIIVAFLFIAAVLRSLKLFIRLPRIWIYIYVDIGNRFSNFQLVVRSWLRRSRRVIIVIVPV